jgi:hypothetical protein
LTITLRQIPGIEARAATLFPTPAELLVRVWQVTNSYRFFSVTTGAPKPVSRDYFLRAVIAKAM